MNHKITVFTPTYNRAYCLHKCYNSLIVQTCKDFTWLIIDDGSTDNTKEIVDGWIKENKVNIKYHFQKNQGMHGAHNAAYRLIDTELNVCIDSDDYMTGDAIEKILKCWSINKNKKYSGIVALNVTTDKKIIGTKLPEYIKSVKLYDMYNKMNVNGDKKLIYRTDVMRKYPEYPIFEGEKYVSLGFKYLLADQDYELVILNEPVCVVEYMDDGSSLNMVHQYRKNPKGFCFIRKYGMKYAPTYKRKLMEAIHYVSSSIMIKNKKFLKESPCKITTIISIPFGIGLYLYIMKTSKDTVMKR